MSIVYKYLVSDEPLDIIRVNECNADLYLLTTQRFRRMWNEYAAAEARLAFVLEHGAFITKSVADGGNSVYQLIRQDENEVFHEMSRWKMTAREAVIEAMERVNGK